MAVVPDRIAAARSPWSPRRPRRPCGPARIRSAGASAREPSRTAPCRSGRGRRRRADPRARCRPRSRRLLPVLEGVTPSNATVVVRGAAPRGIQEFGEAGGPIWSSRHSMAIRSRRARAPPSPPPAARRASGGSGQPKHELPPCRCVHAGQHPAHFAVRPQSTVPLGNGKPSASHHQIRGTFQHRALAATSTCCDHPLKYQKPSLVKT